ncbi:hypothetical protein NPX13_g4716 [Xylaria arbuscula]|uniref:Uncharacterized protein n=1 Tax=Xylaria arbuscula TaxID=114810 RepID=A0A9W8NF03_9PEZI|nr:hypothetical protein NPX13_g4716 [Xylaria arbuscula]
MTQTRHTSSLGDTGIDQPLTPKATPKPTSTPKQRQKSSRNSRGRPSRSGPDTEMAESEHENEGELPKIITVAEDGSLKLLEIDRIASIIRQADEPDKVVADVFREAALHQEAAEKFQIWLSLIWDLVVDHELWKGTYETFSDWASESQNATCSIIAKEGRKLRSKKAEGTNGLRALGAAGPRFQYLVNNETRNLLNAIRQEMGHHRISYPLTTALANLRTYYRIAPDAPGKRGIQRTPCTQPCDISGLDVIGYRLLTTEEMEAAGVQVGPHGLLVDKRKGKEMTPIDDPDFDRAIQSFEVGKRAAEQTSPLAKAAPPIRGLDEQDTKHLKKPVSVRPQTFTFVTQCACPSTVDANLKAELDTLTWNSGYAEIAPLMDRALGERNSLCVRHCQLWLVHGLGIQSLKRKTNRESLVKELSQWMYRLKEQVANQPKTMEDFSDMKKGLAFAWEDVKNIKVPKEVLGKRPLSE